MTTIELPEDALSEMAFAIAERLSAKREPGELPIGPHEVRRVLNELAETQRGPRYAAVALQEWDELGNPSYVVRDRRTGRTEHSYDGYFAGQDARDMAIMLNEIEAGR